MKLKNKNAEIFYSAPILIPISFFMIFGCLFRDPSLSRVAFIAVEILSVIYFIREIAYIFGSISLALKLYKTEGNYALKDVMKIKEKKALKVLKIDIIILAIYYIWLIFGFFNGYFISLSMLFMILTLVLIGINVFIAYLYRFALKMKKK